MQYFEIVQISVWQLRKSGQDTKLWKCKSFGQNKLKTHTYMWSQLCTVCLQLQTCVTYGKRESILERFATAWRFLVNYILNFCYIFKLQQIMSVCNDVNITSSQTSSLKCQDMILPWSINVQISHICETEFDFSHRVLADFVFLKNRVTCCSDWPDHNVCSFDTVC